MCRAPSTRPPAATSARDVRWRARRGPRTGSAPRSSHRSPRADLVIRLPATSRAKAFRLFCPRPSSEAVEEGDAWRDDVIQLDQEDEHDAHPGGKDKTGGRGDRVHG